jgi:hypothetical protein
MCYTFPIGKIIQDNKSKESSELKIKPVILLFFKLQF